VQLVVTDAFTDQFVDYTQTPPLYAAQSYQITEAVYTGLADARRQASTLTCRLAS